MTNFLSSPNFGHQRSKRLSKIAATVLGCAMVPAVSACSAPELKVYPGDIVCSGTQSPTVESGDTFTKLVVEHVDSKGTIDPNTEPGVVLQEVRGITFQLGEIAAGRAKPGDVFVIQDQEHYEVSQIMVTAGNEQPLPQTCIEADLAQTVPTNRAR